MIAENVKIHPTADVSSDANIGANTKIWHQCQVREKAIIGENCILGKNVYIDWNVRIGNGVKVQNNVSIYDAEIADDVFIGPSATFTNDAKPRAFIWDEKRRTKITKIGKGASIGANATIMGGVSIGKFAMVGAGSVVTKDVPEHALVVGVPARIAGFVCECGESLEQKSKTGDFIIMNCKECNNETRIPIADWNKMEKR